MGLFGGGDDKAAARAEAERLAALSLPDLATAVMPAVSPGGLETKSGHQQGAVEVAGWLLREHSKSLRVRQPVLGPTIEALGLLENAGLVTRRPFGRGSTYHATRSGEAALADGTVREQLDP
jgi:hypothetical protein